MVTQTSQMSRELVNVSIRLEDPEGYVYTLEARNRRWAMLKASGGADRMY